MEKLAYVGNSPIIVQHCSMGMHIQNSEIGQWVSGERKGGGREGACKTSLGVWCYGWCNTTQNFYSQCCF